jgi:hypothetical protein
MKNAVILTISIKITQIQPSDRCGSVPFGADS